ncbi:DUF4272 domain-containing protein [Undibacterium sp.]|uniref:DUF4272 domain-containing protein n=1 Tax=Undibacterium sp. TaxID=1914977 RepID=UPI003751E99C
MTPELRKEASELQLHKRGIRINVQLHVIEADEEVKLRSESELAQRLVGLWAISQAAIRGNYAEMRDYLQAHDLTHVLSTEESRFLNDYADKGDLNDDRVRSFQDRLHAFHFLSWCAGLLEKIDLGNKRIVTEKLLEHFPALDKLANAQVAPDAIEQIHSTIKRRRKDAIMDWADLLYRLHWAVRHAQLNNKPSPGSIDPGMVREWHQAVNWMCNYDDENNWDEVSTETTA